MLRPYQEQDVEFLSRLQCAACFNEQRTGKTPTILNVLIRRQLRKVLIICPASAIYSWAEEFVRWTGKPGIPLIGTAQRKKLLIEEWTYGLIVSYDSFKLIKRKDKITGLVHDILKHNPEAIILDEAHRIANPKTATTLAVMETKKIPNRYALTGTPAYGRPHDIYCIIHWLYPNMFRSYWGFMKEYFQIKRQTNHQTGKAYFEIGDFIPGRDRILQRYLAQFTTLRKRKEVMQWLPDKDYQQIKLPATADQFRYLTELSDYFETEDVIAQGVLDRLIRYRQICLHPELLGLKGSSPKLEWIQQYLKDYPGKPTLIFSNFTQWLKLLEDRLDIKKGVVFGDTPIKKRQEYVTAFQEGKLDLLLINTVAGREALTLDRAEVAIFTDKFPPVSDIAQAEDRFISTTPDKADKPHTIIELVMRYTYDELLYSLLRERKEATDIINNYKHYMKGGRQ